MNILIIGQGGREHALAWKMAQSPRATQIWVAPGNAGTALEAKVNNVAIAATDIPALIAWAKQHAIDITVVGPEAPLALGIVDQFQAAGLACLGPSQAASQLESSKAYCKRLMAQYDIPTAAYDVFTDLTAASAYIEQQTYPLVIKADGLAAGKGVIIAQNKEEALVALRSMLAEDQFGAAGKQVVIEEFLTGQEMSYIVMVDGENILPLASSQDHKRRFDQDQGPNTGGMGAFSPSPLLNPEMEAYILEHIIRPMVRACADAGHPYTGFLYAGLMCHSGQMPQVLEFNCRLGDPETQPLMMRLTSDLVTLCEHTLRGQLASHQISWEARSALAVVMAAGAYPSPYQTGDIIEGLADAALPDIHIFHAGTSTNQQGRVITAGGRVLAVTALGNDLDEAHQQAYKQVEKITWRDCGYRNDIGQCI